jgi:hypothetical protein
MTGIIQRLEALEKRFPVKLVMFVCVGCTFFGISNAIYAVCLSLQGTPLLVENSTERLLELENKLESTMDVYNESRFAYTACPHCKDSPYVIVWV